MNEVEAIKIMKYNKHLLGLPDQGEAWRENSNTIACDLAISALEKQMPRKTKYKTTCPACNTYNSVWNKRTNTKPGDIVYCWHCGNAIKLDWRVEE